MTSRRIWPKADLLQQRRLALGLPLQPAPAPPLFSLVIKGSIGALVLVMLAWLALLGLQHRQQHKHQRTDAALDHQGEERRSWCRLQWQAKGEPALLQQVRFGPCPPRRHRSSRCNASSANCCRADGTSVTSAAAPSSDGSAQTGKG